MKKANVTPRELAAGRGCTLDYIYRELWTGKITGARKVGKRWLIPTSVMMAASTEQTRSHNDGTTNR